MRGVLAQGMRTIGRKKQKQNERRMSKENHVATLAPDTEIAFDNTKLAASRVFRPVRRVLISEETERTMSLSKTDSLPHGRRLSKRTMTGWANGFTNYITSGGARDSMRPITQDLYGIPPERVIGSTVASIKNDWKTVFANH
jgi:hypothetical protein